MLKEYTWLTSEWRVFRDRKRLELDRFNAEAGAAALWITGGRDGQSPGRQGSGRLADDADDR